jgi:hypothetical protein
MIIKTATGIELSIFRFFSPGEKYEIRDVFEPTHPTSIEQRINMFDTFAKEWLSREDPKEKENKKLILDNLKEALINNHTFNIRFINPEQLMDSLIIEGMKKQFEH